MGLEREEVRRRLAGRCPPVDKEQLLSAPGVPAAVLVALIARSTGPQIVLTRRQAHLKDHASEISFPGGRLEAGDDGPAAAALRETFEEIGLASERVELLGCLPPYRTVSDFRVYPLVGWVEPPVVLKPDPREVAEVFEVPLSFVLDPVNHRCEGAFLSGEQHRFHVLTYEDHRIWGATAGMLVDLAKALA